MSILDGIFMAIKDDIDCYPYLTKGKFRHPFFSESFFWDRFSRYKLVSSLNAVTSGATTWFHKVRAVTQDAVCVSRLRSSGVIFIGKANMHELGLGTTGNNPNYG